MNPAFQSWRHGLSLLVDSAKASPGSPERRELEQMALQYFQIAAHHIRTSTPSLPPKVQVCLDYPNTHPSSEPGWLWMIAMGVQFALDCPV